MHAPDVNQSAIATPPVERRHLQSDRRLTAERRLARRLWHQANADRRANATDRRLAIGFGRAIAELAQVERECAAAESRWAEADALWAAALTAYEQAEAAWSEARAERSRARAAVAKAQIRVEKLKPG